MFDVPKNTSLLKKEMEENLVEGKEKKEEVIQEMFPHPLENVLVLETLFECDLGVDFLRRNRLVCKSWLQASVKRWRQVEKYPVLTFVPGENGQGISLAEFYARYQAGDPAVVQMVDNPHSRGKLTLLNWEMVQGCRVDHWFWDSLMFKCVKRLTLSNCRFSKRVWVFEETFLKDVPQLEELRVKACVLEDEALEALRVANQHWMQHPGRENWLRTRRNVQNPRNFFDNLTLVMTNVPYYPEGYQHHKLTSLEVSLSSQVEGQRAIRFWGPLLAMLPNLRSLEVRGYGLAGAEDGEIAPLELTPLGGEDDPKLQRLRLRGRMSPEDLKFWAEARSSWLGGNFESVGLPPPTQRGYFWELFWFHEIGQVIGTLKQLDLLDFSQRAQDYGVFSTVEIANKVKDLSGSSRVYSFSQLTSLAFDLGLDPLFAERDLKTLCRWTEGRRKSLEELVLYRAPFCFQFPRLFCGIYYVQRLELWGNVSSSLNILRACGLNLTRFSWNTTCYEDKWKGQRLHHLLRGEGERAYPLHKTDLVEATNWDEINERPWFKGFLRLSRWEMDWSMELKSWAKLAKVMPNLTWLKGRILGDEQLEEVVRLWPDLEVLEMQHDSRVTLGTLAKQLTKLDSLKKFKWRGCPCTQKLFREKEGKGREEVEKKESFWGNLEKDKPQIEMELPWEDETTSAFENSSGEKFCIQAMFESALLTGNSVEFFKLLECPN